MVAAKSGVPKRQRDKMMLKELKERHHHHPPGSYCVYSGESTTSEKAYAYVPSRRIKA